MKSKMLRALLLIIVVLAALVFFLPAILSSSFVRGFVLNKANEAAPGKVSVDDWKLSWGKGIHLSGIAYRDESAGMDVAVEKIDVSKGLAELIRDHQNLGEIAILNPQIRLVAPEKPAAPEPSGKGRGGKRKAAEPSPKKKPAPEKPAAKPLELPALAVDFKMSGGRVDIVAADGLSTQVIDQIDANFVMKGPSEPVEYSFSCAMSGGGSLSAKGTTTLSEDGKLVVGRIATGAEISATEVDLAPLTAWLASQAPMPVVHSRLNAGLNVQGSMAEGIRVRGAIRLPGTRLTGSALKGDEPNFGDIAVLMDALCATDRVEIGSLMLRSGFANLKVSGSMSKTADGVIETSGSVDLAALARELPATLGLQEGVELSEGTVVVSGMVARAAGQTQFEGSAAVDTLRGSRNGEIIAWDAPTRIEVRGQQGAGAFKLDHFAVTSPFMSGSGSGDLNQLKLHVDASLDKALQEAGKFVDLKGWNAAGNLSADVSVASEGDSRNLNCVLASPSMSITSAGKTVAPAGPVSLNMTGALKMPDGKKLESLENLSVSWQTWLSAGNMFLESLELPGTLKGAKTSASLDLSALASVLDTVGAAPAGTQLGGTVQLDLTADATPETVSLAEASVVVRNLAAGNEKGIIRDDEISIRTAGTLQPRSKQAQFPAVQVRMGAGSVNLNDVQLAQDSVKARVISELDLKALLATLDGFAKLPEGTAVSGISATDIQLAFEKGSLNLKANGSLKSLEILSRDSEPIREDEITFAAEANRDASGAFSVKNATMASKAVQLALQANMKQDGGARSLTASGEFGLDLDLLAGYARALTGMDLQMSGRQRQPFEFASEWSADDPGGMMKNARLDTGLQVETIKAFGLEVSSLKIPVKVADGKAVIDITAGVNGGQLAAHPVIDFAAEPAAIVLRNPTNILSGVQLTDELSNELLARIHPLFKGSSEVTGLLSMGMDEFYWPLDPALRPQARFNGTIKFQSLKLATHGLLEKMLEAMKVRERNAEFGDRSMDFRCENDRIACSPFNFKVDHHDVSLAGSMGLDQSLDYVAQVPLTRELVGDDAAKYLEGTTVRMPIRGTSMKPELGVNVLTEASGDLIKQAAKKALQEEAGKLLEGLFKK